MVLSRWQISFTDAGGAEAEYPAEKEGGGRASTSGRGSTSGSGGTSDAGAGTAPSRAGSTSGAGAGVALTSVLRDRQCPPWMTSWEQDGSSRSSPPIAPSFPSSSSPSPAATATAAYLGQAPSHQHLPGRESVWLGQAQSHLHAPGRESVWLAELRHLEAALVQAVARGRAVEAEAEGGGSRGEGTDNAAYSAPKPTAVPAPKPVAPQPSYSLLPPDVRYAKRGNEGKWKVWSGSVMNVGGFGLTLLPLRLQLPLQTIITPASSHLMRGRLGQEPAVTLLRHLLYSHLPLPSSPLHAGCAPGRRAQQHHSSALPAPLLPCG